MQCIMCKYSDILASSVRLNIHWYTHLRLYTILSHNPVVYATLSLPVKDKKQVLMATLISAYWRTCGGWSVYVSCFCQVQKRLITNLLQFKDLFGSFFKSQFVRGEERTQWSPSCVCHHRKVGCLCTCNHTTKLWCLPLGQSVAGTGLGL